MQVRLYCATIVKYKTGQKGSLYIFHLLLIMHNNSQIKDNILIRNKGKCSLSYNDCAISQINVIKDLFISYY